MTESMNTFPGDDDGPLNEIEVATLVARICDMILAETEDPGEHEHIINEAGDVLDGWDKSFPMVPHPLAVVVEEIFNGKGKKVMKEQENRKD